MRYYWMMRFDDDHYEPSSQKPIADGATFATPAHAVRAYLDAERFGGMAPPYRLVRTDGVQVGEVTADNEWVAVAQDRKVY